MLYYSFAFFFSSRRRHTRLTCVWSSDVCSSDLYACDETKELMPMPIQYAHQLAAKLAEVRKKKIKGIDWLRPDGKTQVSVRYEDGRVTGIEAIVVSTQHDEKVKS